MKNDAQEMTAKRKEKPAPKYVLILLNDQFHSFEYVINMCKTVFNYSDEQGKSIANEVHNQGKCIIWGPGPLEVAELKQDQVHAIGKDPLIFNCQGSMTAYLEEQ